MADGLEVNLPFCTIICHIALVIPVRSGLGTERSGMEGKGVLGIVPQRRALRNGAERTLGGRSGAKSAPEWGRAQFWRSFRSEKRSGMGVKSILGSVPERS